MRNNGFRGIGGLAQRLTSTLAPKGKAAGKGASAPLARLKAQWPAIVGAEIARVSRPEALTAGRSARGTSSGGAMLKLRVAGAASLEIQHRSAQLVERVNAYFGHRLIDDIRLLQGGFVPTPPPRSLPAPNPAQQAQIAERVASVKDPDLKAALARLGGRIAATRRGVLLGALGTLGATMFPRAGHAQVLPLPNDHVLGDPAAPNVLIDYFSFTCPHCANFHATVMPMLQEKWIKPGKLKFIYRHFPSEAVATHASQFAECAGPARFYEAADVLFGSQIDWLTAADPDAEMAKQLKAKGFPTDGCLANDQLIDRIVDDVQSGQIFGVRATPTLFLQGQNIGSQTSESLAKILTDNAR